MAHNPELRNLDALVRTHLPQALRFAVRLTGNPNDAEDLVQEALTRVVKSWKTFRGDSQFSTWLSRIMINVFRDQLAKDPWREMPADLIDLRSIDPVDQAYADELGRIIAERVSALPPRQREVLVLIAYEGRSPRETAHILEIHEENVYATLHTARKRLRRELAAQIYPTN